MSALLEILFDVITTLIPWRSSHEDRSIVGESDLDRSARNAIILFASIGMVIALAIGVWLYFRK
jgi:hypothetical protein